MLITLKEYAAKVGLNYGSLRNAVAHGTFVPDKKVGQHWFVESERKYPNKPIKLRGKATNDEYNSYSRLHNIWRTMKKRCCNPRYEKYCRYGGRGIKVCDEWLHDYQAFKEWSLSHGYANDLVIDRIDNDGNYEPSNCQWITRSENSRKKNKTIAEWESYKMAHNM